MYILIGIIFIIVGLVMLIKPQIVFHIVESWKYSSDTDPSDSYIVNTRIGGVAFLIIGVANIIVFLLP